MLFNSIEFAIFLPLVFVIYWFVIAKKLFFQNLFIVIASYFFIGWWDWYVLLIISFTTILNYTFGLAIGNNDYKSKRKFLLWLSILSNLSILAVFKYYNFFIDNFIIAFTFLGHNAKLESINLVLPVGISFYTFQTMSYTIDVFRKKIEPTKDIIAFSAFISFFPQLIAGPIERASNLLPQCMRQRAFDYRLAVDGMRQILWGLFKKVVIADNCAEYANLIFGAPENYSGSTLLLGAFFFAIQIYGDFSGYSDIAIGTARLFGFDLMRNFAFPYFSRNIAEFWKRWHISLSTWFRDYVYIPLGGSRSSTIIKIRNTFIIFLLSGFWHGANWTFICWGILNALYYLPLLLTGKNRNDLSIVAEGKILPSLSETLKILFTFTLTVFAWIFFRSDSVGDAFAYISGILSPSLLTIPYFTGIGLLLPFTVILFSFITIEWLGREHSHCLSKFALSWPRQLRWAFYYLLIFVIFWYSGKQQEFIYFQF
jgi:D-alanyl-lipoteichoic acid acyltransferase DltB (MBOAT superfamily)